MELRTKCDACMCRELKNSHTARCRGLPQVWEQQRWCGPDMRSSPRQCLWLPDARNWGFTKRKQLFQNKKKTLEKNSNSSEGVEAANKVSRVVQDPLDTPLMDPNIIHGPKTKRWCRSSVANSVRALISTILDNPQGILRWD
jgi:hypothetical protein